MVSRSSSTSPGSPVSLGALGGKQLDPFAPMLEPGAGKGGEALNLAHQLDRRTRPVDPRLLLADLGGVGGALLGLRNGIEAQ